MPLHWITNKVDKQTAEILLYGYIGPGDDVSALRFVNELRALEKEYSQINLRINSGGGSVFEGLAIYNAIKQSPATITAYIDGLAASMASIIMLAGNKVLMSKSARIMTHQPSVGGYGNSAEHLKNASLLEGLEKTMLAIYSARTGKSETDCKNIFLNGKDNWFDHTTALNNKLIDGVYDGAAIEVAASSMNEKQVWEQYNQEFAAKFTQTNNDMTKNYLSMTALAALKLTDKVEDSAIDAAIVAMAGKVDALQTELTAANTAKATAEKALTDLKAASVVKDVADLLAQGVTDKKLTVEMKNKLAVDYKENPTGLKDLLAVMQPVVSIAEKINTGAATDLSAKTWDELDKSNKLEDLKAKQPDAFFDKFKEKYGKVHSEDKRP